MGMVIHDDFWEAAQAMPEKQRAPFIYAICEYRFTGKEPEGSPAWLPTFLVIKKRIELSDEASEKARSKARARWSKRDAAASNDSDATAHAQHMHSTCTADAAASNDSDAAAHAAAQNYSDAEGEDEKEYIDNPYIPFSEIVDYLNERAGTSYRNTSRKTRSLIHARVAEGYDLDDFKAVIDTMVSEWGNDPKMSAYLRPETLFGTKFESYLNRKPRTKAKEARYAEYA